MEFAVSQSGTARITLHGGSETTAREEATEELETSLAVADAVTDWQLEDASIYEQPSAPFEPYTIAVGLTITVTVEAADSETASETGTDLIDTILEQATVDTLTDKSEPTVTAI